MAENTDKQNLYKKYKEDRDKRVYEIVQSDAPKKVIVAGPGTGKSYLFEEICKRNIVLGKKNNLVLSFINELVDDLTIDLHKLADVKTLHSFARSKIEGHDKYFLDLENIINKDYKIIYGKEIDFGKILCRLINDEEAIKFYFARREYYDHHSPISSIYLLVKFFNENKANIPEYSQILIDEFQDFNKLESTLIDLLSEKSPILIVGDDDQSLYSWKHADPEDIRAKVKSPDYKSFELPYCSRCTKVIIDAFNCIVNQAKTKGFLNKRRDKPFKYFSSEEKDLTSDKYPTISVKNNVYSNSESYHIDTEIRDYVIPKNKENVSVLVICPFKKHIEPIEKMLRKRGYRNITSRINRSSGDLINGFNLLLRDSTCNLGWRIVSENILDKEKFNRLLKESYKNGGRDNFYHLLDFKTRKQIKSLLATIRKIKKRWKIDDINLNEVVKFLGYNPYTIITDKLREDIETGNIKNIHKDIPIKITTIQGSKGLDGDYVFLVNFDERFIFKNNGTDITDEVVCNFLVALTRTRKKLFIFSSTNKLPAFVNWLNEEIYEVMLT